VVSDAISGLRALAASLPPGTAVPVPRELLLTILGGKTRGAAAGPDLPTELTQREAARVLRVSVSFLRASSCPKHLLPGNGPRGRPLVRYLRDEVLQWGTARALAPARRKAS
jgi:hypothetical protein